MTTEAEQLIEDAIFSVADGVPNYDRFTYAANELLQFNGKTASDWIEEVALPSFNDDMELDDLDRSNQVYFNATEIIMSNHARARNGFNYADIHYKRSLIYAKDEIMKEIHEFNRSPANSTKRRMPGKETMDEMAKEKILTVYTSQKIAKLWFEFWESQYEKMKLASFRLTGMNTLKNVESRIGAL
jgi:hypothetical protein